MSHVVVASGAITLNIVQVTSMYYSGGVWPVIRYLGRQQSIQHPGH